MSKIRLTFKTPDVAYEALQEIHDEEEKDIAKAVISKFVRWGEYLDVEIDTETVEAKVLTSR